MAEIEVLMSKREGKRKEFENLKEKAEKLGIYISVVAIVDYFKSIDIPCKKCNITCALTAYGDNPEIISNNIPFLDQMILLFTQAIDNVENSENDIRSILLGEIGITRSNVIIYTSLNHILKLKYIYFEIIKFLKSKNIKLIGEGNRSMSAIDKVINSSHPTKRDKAYNIYRNFGYLKEHLINHFRLNEEGGKENDMWLNLVNDLLPAQNT